MNVKRAVMVSVVREARGGQYGLRSQGMKYKGWAVKDEKLRVSSR